MPKIKIIAAGPSDGPSIPTATAFFGVLEEIEAFQNQHTEDLTYEHYEMLSETATVMRTLANFLSCNLHVEFLISQLREAEQELAFYRQLMTRAE